MESSTLRPDQLATSIENVYRAFLKESSGWVLVELVTSLSFGIGINWFDPDVGEKLDNLDIYIVETTGTFENPDWADDGLGITDYLPGTALAKSGPGTTGIDECLKAWKTNLPLEKDGLDEHDPWGRTERFKSLVVGTPTLWPSVRESLAGCINEEFRKALHEISSEWLYCKRSVRL